MNSPVNIEFQSFIKIDRSSKEAVFMQIVYQIINAVNLKLLKDGDLLPGSRKMAEALKVHRKTAIAALTELQDQGWIESVPSIGSFVRHPSTSNQAKAISSLSGPPKEAPYRFRKELILDIAPTETMGKYYFTDGRADKDLIDISEQVRFYGGVLKRQKRTHTLSSDLEASLYFKEQLSVYLNLSRGFHIAGDKLLPISSKEKIFSILSRLLIETGDLILVGELSYYLPNMIFSQAGAKIKTIPLDEWGLDVDFIKAHYKPGEIRCIYVNSLSHYPTTVRLSEKRKSKLLALSKEYDFIIIEDDGDFEFSTLKDKSESLFKKEGGDRVIYIGAIGQYLHPSFQMNFLIAPHDVLEEGKKYLNIFGKTDFMLERALGEMIHQGDLLRYQRKSNKAILARKKAFADLLKTYFKDQISFSIPESGLAFWIVFKIPLPLIKLQSIALEKGLIIPKICLYQTKAVTAIRLSFAHLNMQDMDAAIGLLYAAFLELTGQSPLLP